MTAVQAKKIATPAPQIEIIECEQGSDVWKKVRLGLPTASNFSAILASGKDGGESKTRRDYMYRLAGEILTGEPTENYKNAFMDRGNQMEEEARAYYSRTNFVELEHPGFIKRTLPSGVIVGASPDSLVKDTRGGLEIKTQAPHLLIEQLIRGTFPTEHRAQTQGVMWVADLEWLDLMLFYRGMPVAPKFRIERDENYIRDLSNAVEVFAYDLKRLVERIRAMGR